MTASPGSTPHLKKVIYPEFYYRSQLSCGKVMLLRPSVILFGGWGGALCPGGLCQGDPPVAIRLHAGGTHPTGMHSCFLLSLQS